MLMLTIFRDLGFFTVSLILYDVLLYKGIIYYYEAVILLCVIVLYIATIVIMNRWAGSGNGGLEED